MKTSDTIDLLKSLGFKKDRESSTATLYKKRGLLIWIWNDGTISFDAYFKINSVSENVIREISKLKAINS
jgi:hypothetical protein